MTTTLDRPKLGEGTYTFGEAARILRRSTRTVTNQRLRYWIKTGLSPASRVADDGEDVLTFEDLVSLEIVHRLRDEGASLQSIRRVEVELRRLFPELERPFAHELFFTDGASVWAQVHGEDAVIEIVGKNRSHYAWRDAIRTFARDIRFEGPGGKAARWTLSPWVEINPTIQFGAPVVTGTRVAVRTVAANLEVGTPSEVADWYGLREEQVLGVRDYLAAH